MSPSDTAPPHRAAATDGGDLATRSAGRPGLLLLAALLPASAKKKGGRRCWGPRPCGATPPLANATKNAVRALCVAPCSQQRDVGLLELLR